MGRILCCVFVTVTVLSTVSSGERDSGNVEPELRPDSAVMQLLEKLGDNSSAVLPPTRVVGDPGPLTKEYKMDKRGPGGRDFTIKMAWMPDRKRAFFCGANHGSPHRLNDAWEYDLAANAWVVLYPADYNDRGPVTDFDREKLELKDGWLRTKGGGPAHPAHTWWGLTYDLERKAVLWWCQWPPYRLDAKLAAIGATREQLYKGPPLWAFYPEKKRWEPLSTKQPWPRQGLAGSLEYVPELRGTLWMHPDAGTWLLESATLSWQNLSRGKERPPIETVMCYDSGRKLVLAHRGPQKEDAPCRTWHMSVTGADAGEWKKVLEKPGLPNGHDASSFFYFDPVGRVGLLYEVPRRSIWAYDPEKIEWTELKPEGPPPPEKGDARPVAYFDTARNVFVVSMGTLTWVYRYRKPISK
ncbi:MAG: hypothetical protein ACUVWX_06435 [Kiritimatiellia bacterium]